MDLVIIGLGEFASIATDYFTNDSDYNVVGYAAECEFVKANSHGGLPLISLDELGSRFSSQTTKVFVAVTNSRLNRDRRRLVNKAKELGFELATYISSNAFIGERVSIGENVFIFENNVIQNDVKIGDGSILWSGNHVGHQSSIGKFVFVASHVVISGYCTVGDCVFIGVNSAIADHIEIAKDCVLGMASIVQRSIVVEGSVLKTIETDISKVSAYRLYRLKP